MAKKNVKITQKQQDNSLLELYPITRAGNVEELFDEFSSSKTYEVGDIVVYNGDSYKCTTAITTAGAWDSTKWAIITSGHNQKVKGNGVTFGNDDVVDIKGSGVITVTGNATNKDITISTTAEANVLEGVQLNGTDLTISSKKVNVQIKRNGTLLTNTSGAVDISVPIKTSDITNDGDGTNAFITNATAQIAESQVTNLTNDLQNIREVAEGKTSTYVVSYATNAGFNSNNATITLSSSVTDTSGNTVTLAQLNIGDNFLVTETDVPDRWVSAITKSGDTVTSVTLNKLETAKVDISNMVSTSGTLTSGQIITGAGDKTVQASGVSIETSATTTLTNVDTAVPTTKVLTRELGNKVTANNAITGATKTKITYDSKGLVTAGADLAESDIPALSISKTTGLQTALDNKLDDSQLKTSWSSTTSDSNIPSEKLVKDSLDNKLTASTAKVQLTGDVTSSAVSLTNDTASITTTLSNSGVTAGTYSAVAVNAKGLVTSGAQMIEVGTTGQTTPSASLAVGGIFYQEV